MKVLLVDDHGLFREGLAHVLRGLAANVELHQAADAQGARQALDAQGEFDLVLIDLALPDSGPFDLLTATRQAQPQVPVVIVSATESRFEIERAMSLGAQGYVFKSCTGAELLAALRRVIDGHLVFPERALDAQPATLTPRQQEVLTMLARGLSNREIGDALGVSENTVKVHLAAIFRALGVTSRTHALLKAQSLGLSLEPH